MNILLRKNFISFISVLVFFVSFLIFVPTVLASSENTISKEKLDKWIRLEQENNINIFQLNTTKEQIKYKDTKIAHLESQIKCKDTKIAHLESQIIDLKKENIDHENKLLLAYSNIIKNNIESKEDKDILKRECDQKLRLTNANVVMKDVELQSVKNQLKKLVIKPTVKFG